MTNPDIIQVTVWTLCICIASVIFYSQHRRLVDGWIKWVEGGYAKVYYHELFMWGAITMEEYLRLVKEIDEQ